MDAETISRGAGTGLVAGTVLGAVGPEAAVEAPGTDSRNAQTARVWARAVVRPGANAWKGSRSVSIDSTSAWTG